MRFKGNDWLDEQRLRSSAARRRLVREGMAVGVGAAAGWWLGHSSSGVAGRSLARHGYQALFEATPTYIATYSFDGTVLSVNPAAAAALGYAPEELVEGSFENLVPAERRPRFDAHLQRLQESQWHSSCGDQKR